MNVRVPPAWWSPRHYQLPAMQWMESGGRFADLCWHRRCGKDLFSIAWTAIEAVKKVGIYWHILPKYSQARKAIWDGRTNDGRAYLDLFPKEIVKQAYVNEMKIELDNGSIWQLQGADEPDRLVGTNPRGVVFSEWSLMNPSIYQLTIRPILAANGGWAMFIYTPRGENHAYEQKERIKTDKKWFSSSLTVEETHDETGNPVVSQEEIEQCRKEGMDEALIQQEYYCSFQQPLVGSYYGDFIKRAESDGRIRDVPYDPRLDVHTAWDIGVGDSTALWFYQVYGLEVRVIDYYENSGEGLLHYIKNLRERDYAYLTHLAPHDIQVREFTSGRSRWETAREHGIRFKTVPKHDVNDGIEAVRNLLPRCYFDKTKCKHGLRALKEYHKEWDETRQCFKDNPCHDWSSHPADAFRILAWGLNDKPKRKEPLQRKAVSEYAILDY